MVLLNRLTGFFSKKPPPVTGMAALTAKRNQPPQPPPKAKSKKGGAELTDVEDIMKYCFYGLVAIVGGFSLVSLASSAHYGNEARKRTADSEHTTEKFNGGAPPSTHTSNHRLKSWL
eukprot:TRINITY_DN6153_c0_g1_i2.p1 TRINITY_DN6153_c0_g1~~TRINITY_DN6153_c0_g1_i2.p1  ORF type:complete len:117 (+),score=18.72 TRINITY_DN6153_c0_g1_i2:48-398(+)